MCKKISDTVKELYHIQAFVSDVFNLCVQGKLDFL